MACREETGRAPVLDRVFRRSISANVSVRDRRGKTGLAHSDSRVRESPAGSRSRRAVSRSDAPSRWGPKRDGFLDRLALLLGQRSGLPAIQPRHGAPRERRTPSGRARTRAPRELALSARRELVQLSGAAILQGEVQSGVGAALHGISE